LSVKVFVHAEHFHRIALAQFGLDTPDRLQCLDGGMRDSAARTHPLDRRDFQHDAQIVELIELVEVDRRDFPAAPEADFQIALAL
jgi:hypothetical protein